MTLKRSKILMWTMVQIPRSGLGLLLGGRTALGSVTAAGADTPATVQQNGVSSLEVDVHKDVAEWNRERPRSTD